jgi:hypothetical protein
MEQAVPPVNRFSCLDCGLSPSYLPHDFTEAFLIFLPITLLLTWALHRRFPEAWSLLSSVVAAGVTVLLTYPIRYFMWLLDLGGGVHLNSVSSVLFRPRDMYSLGTMLILLFAFAALLSSWLKYKPRHAEREVEE